MTLLLSPVLWLCLAIGAGGCNPKQDPTGPRTTETLTATEIAGIRLTYMCGNTFRVRNPNAEEVAVTWDVYSTGETGSVTLPPKPADGLHSETFFTTVNRGTVRLFYNGQLIQTKANGNKPPCQVASDTTTPPVPADFAPPSDSTRTVAVPNDPVVRYYRHIIGIIFDDTTSGATINAVFRKYQAVVVGGMPDWGTRGAYIVEVPDTVTTYQGLQGFIENVGSEVGVDFAFGETWRDKIVPRGRYPADGAGSQRNDWTNPGAGSITIPGIAIRLPLAWGCEAGIYSSNRTTVGIIDFTFDTGHPDLASSTKSLVEAPLNTMRPSQFLNDPQDGRSHRSHGTAVAGVLAAQGDNGLGIAGVIWGGNLKMYAYARGTDETRRAARFLAGRVLPDARRAGVRVLLTSLGAGEGSDTSGVHLIRQELRRYLQANNGSVLVIATGAENRQIPVATALATAHPTFTALDRAALELYSSFPKQIIFVTGTDNQGAFRSPANVWIGSTWVAAPFDNITTLARTSEYSTGTDLRSGTSYSAPFVAGVAAQLLAMDPTLRGSEIGEYIYRGSRRPRVDPATGESTAPSEVIGYPEIYQLDAYGALSLLSSERKGTPLCGVEAQLEQVSGGNRLRIDRSMGPEYIAMQPQAQFITSFSVAQGGRLVGFSGYSHSGPAAFRHQLAEGTWDSAGTVPGVDRMIFLERDTAYLTGESAPGDCNPIAHLRLRIESEDPARRVNRLVTEGLRSSCSSLWGGEVLQGPSPVSPDGEWIYVPWGWDDTRSSCPSVARGSGNYVVPTRGGSREVLSEFSDSYSCDDTNVPPVTRDNGYVAWRGDAQEFYFGRTRYAGNSRTLGLSRYTVTGGVIPVGTQLSIGNLHLVHVAWDIEGGRIYTQEWVPDNEPCYQRIRSANDPSIVVGETSTILDYCGLGIFMAPLRQHPMSASAEPGWGSAAQLARALNHQGARRIAYPRVRVN